MIRHWGKASRGLNVSIAQLSQVTDEREKNTPCTHPLCLRSGLGEMAHEVRFHLEASRRPEDLDPRVSHARHCTLPDAGYGSAVSDPVHRPGRWCARPRAQARLHADKREVLRAGGHEREFFISHTPELLDEARSSTWWHWPSADCSRFFPSRRRYHAFGGQLVP